MLSRVEWEWNLGSVTTEFFYGDGNKKIIHMSKTPPTTPAHDISHFICGFHPDLEWDFSINPNHIAEYNAVYVECILFLFYSYPDIDDNELKNQLNVIDDHMKWFTYKHYKIPNHLGSKYTDIYLKNKFMSKFDPIITSKFYSSYYYATYLIEDLKLQKDQIQIQLTLDSDSNTINQECFEYLLRIKNLGN